MKFAIAKGSTSVILTVNIQDSSSTTGAGLAGLIHTSSIVGGYVKRNGTGVALVVDEDVTTEGTYQAPSAAGKVRIGTPANMRPGTYELHFHNDLFTSADWVTMDFGGASNMADLHLEVQLGFDLSTATQNVNIVSSDNIALTDQQKLDVNAECDTALAGYDGPTKAEMDTAHALLATVAKQDVIDGIVDSIVADTNELQTDNIPGTLSTIQTSTDRLTAVRAAVLTDWINGGRLDLLLDAIQTDLDNGTDGLGALKTLIDALNDLSAADVNAQVVDVIRTDTTGEPGQGAPGATLSLSAKIDFLFKAWRNKTTQSATEWNLRNDGDSANDQKATVSDDTTTFTKGEIGTGA